MNKIQAKLPLSYRWPVLFWVGVVFCFFVFPVFLADLGLESLLNARNTLQKQQLFRDLNRNLEKLLQYRNGRHYYHALLKRIFTIANQQQDPEAYLQKAIPHLKARNPGIFRFIVWNKEGQVIDSITDEKGYKYIVKTVFETFSEINEDNQQNYPGTPADLPVIARRLNLLKSYLGAFLIPEKMNLPLLRSNLGEIVLAASENEKAHFWFQSSDKFTMMAQIALEATASNEYLKKLVAGMNRSGDKEIKIGIAQLLDGKDIFMGFEHPDKEELTVEVNKFINFSDSELESENYLIAVRLLNPFVLAFTCIPKTGNLLDPRRSREKSMLFIALIIAVVSVVFAYLVFFKQKIISIRFKLAILFVYANGLPLMILGFIGYEYLQQNRRLLLSQAREQVATLISDFDSRYSLIKKSHTAMLNEIVTSLNHKLGDRGVTKEDFSPYFDVLMDTKPFDVALGDLSGRLFHLKTTQGRSSKFFANMSKNILRYVNFKSYTPQNLFRTGIDSKSSKKKLGAEAILSSDSIVFHRFLLSTGKIAPEQMGTEGRQYYWNMLGNIAERKIHNIMVVSWEHDVMQQAYARDFLEQLNANFGNFKFYAIVEANGVTLPEKSEISRDIFNLFRQTFSLKTAFSDEIEADGNRYAAFGAIGKQLDRLAIVGLIPLDDINEKLNTIKFRILFFAILSLSLTLGIGRLLSLQFMRPVRELENGVKAIGRQDFRYRLPLDSADEFGQLTTVFNSALESLQELEIAQVVQENLFPQDSLKLNKLEVLGKSVSMTRLGGDYYDFFKIDNEYAGVLMGDVAGHGIPAAMLMAMAKGSVLLSEEEKMDPALMLSSLHKVIHRVKSSKIKRMMTCQYFTINTLTGEYSVSNAGHCFPAVIRKRGAEVELVKLIGTPLGITRKPKYANSSFKLEPGDVVLLYTDGIVEAQNSQGKELGFENFSSILAESFDEDLLVYYDRIFAAYKNWAPNADDDITMVLFRFDAEELKS